MNGIVRAVVKSLSKGLGRRRFRSALIRHRRRIEIFSRIDVAAHMDSAEHEAFMKRARRLNRHFDRLYRIGSKWGHC
jgi:hypothetical protein